MAEAAGRDGLDVDVLAGERAAYRKAVRIEECRPQGLQRRLERLR